MRPVKLLGYLLKATVSSRYLLLLVAIMISVMSMFFSARAASRLAVSIFPDAAVRKFLPVHC